MRIAFTGGGTGGHLTPIIAVAREIRRITEAERLFNVELVYFGPEPIAPSAMADEEITFIRITAGKFRRYVSLLNFTDLFKTVAGIFEAFWKLFRTMPDVMFSKGGYGSFPTLIAARIYRIPVMIHESDAVSGTANRMAGRWATRIAISFPSAAKYFPPKRTALTGTPIRSRILGGTPDAAREALGVFSERPVLFIMGGSQGARAVNEATTNVLKELLRSFEVIHQVGEKNFQDVALETKALLGEDPGVHYYHPVAFLDEEHMRGAYLLADLIISRAGSTSLFEIAAGGKPSIIIPITNSARDHQRENAYAYGGHGAAIVIEEDNLTPHVLLNEITKLMSSPERRKKMSQAAQSFSRLEAAEVIAREIIALGLH